MNETKILVFGDVNGQIMPLAKKIDAYNSKAGPFEMVVCVGDFFGSSFVGGASVELLRHDPQYKELFPVPTYILQPCEPQLYSTVPSGELCHNLINLGKNGIITTTSGVRIVYLSGHSELSAGNNPPAQANGSDAALGKFQVINKTDTINLIKRCMLAGMQTDLLITHAWPYGIEQNSSSSGDAASFGPEHCSKLLARVVAALKPRYHFCALKNLYFERPPFRHHQVLQAQANAPATRFVGLAGFNNPDKRKFVYAFNVVPASKLSRAELHKQPEGTTESPFAALLAKLAEAEPLSGSSTVPNNPRRSGFGLQGKREGNFSQLDGLVDDNVDTNGHFFFDMSTARDSSRRGGRGGGNKRKFDADGTDGTQRKQHSSFAPEKTESCWFCLRRPEVEKHLIVSIGEHCYLALAKGGMTPDHVMILPISHKQSTTQFSDDEMRELNMFKRALRRCFQATDNKKCIAFERNYRSSHAQVQIVPVPAALSNETVKQVAEREAQNSANLELQEIPQRTDLRQVLQPGIPYFLLELPRSKTGNDAEVTESNDDSVQCEQMFARIKGSFPLNFGRELLACEEVLDMPDRIDWKVCKVSQEEESEMAKTFRNKFRAHDFTLSS